MELQIHAKGLELNDDTQEYIRKKLGKLERHLTALTAAKVEVARTSARAQNQQFIAQCTLSVNGRFLRGQETGLSILEAIDTLAEVMDRQIRRYKTKYYRTSQARRSARAGQRKQADVSAAVVSAMPPEPEGLGKVVRIKRFPMSPMSVEDAIAQMELLSHNFFFNADANQFNLLYRRRSGDYGPIQPDLT
ncbi:MAG: ribosome-associated translation inhibitor RaiA [SAR202 cluster bacterium]|nr:ribosome-associated translation inhibitor RaiA [SAR202 cluster bacterium]